MLFNVGVVLARWATGEEDNVPLVIGYVLDDRSQLFDVKIFYGAHVRRGEE